MPIAAGKYIWSTGCVELVPGMINGVGVKKIKARKIALSMLHSLRGDSLNEQADITKHVHCMYGENLVFNNNRVALVAHYDKDGHIDESLIELCKHFKKLGYKVVICSHAKPNMQNHTQGFLQDYQNFADAIIYRDCDGYDFTSWKAAFAFFPSLWQCTELLLTNDSYFGPINFAKHEASFAPIYAHMKKFTCDFWGISLSWQRVAHIQSYFIVLKKNIIQSQTLKDFFAAVPLSSNRGIAIAQELSFSLWLSLHGFKAAAFCFPLAACNRGVHNINPTLHGHEILLAKGLAFIKREAVRSPHGFATILNNLKYKNFEKDFLRIENYFLRTQAGANFDRGVGEHGMFFPPHVAAAFEPINLTLCKTEGATQDKALLVFIHAESELGKIDIENLSNNLKFLPYGAKVYAFASCSNAAKSLMQVLSKHNFENVIKQVKPYNHPLISLLEHIKNIDKNHFILQINANAESLKLRDLSYNTLATMLSNLWQKHIYASLLGSSVRVENIINTLNAKPDLFCIAPVLYPPFLRTTQGEHAKIIQYILAQLGMDFNDNIAIDYPAGGMFWCRLQMLMPLSALLHKQRKQLEELCKQHKVSLGASLEKILFFSCALQKKRWSRVVPMYEKNRLA